MRDERLEVSVTFDERRGYTASSLQDIADALVEPEEAEQRILPAHKLLRPRP